MKAGMTPFQRTKDYLKKRWSAEEYPGGNSTFQIGLMAKDVAIFILLPIGAIVLFKLCEIALSGKPPEVRTPMSESPRFSGTEKRSQIIEFRGLTGSGGIAGLMKRAPGTLIRLRMMNVVDTFGTAPVHAQIIDKGLGPSFVGGTLIGDATSDTNSNRVSVVFRFARMPNRPEMAVSIAARALSLDGTIGIPAEKKEGFFARATLHASTNVGTVETGSNSNNLGNFIARALATGMMQEFGSDAQVAHNQAQVLTVPPMTEFYAELTDFFPGQSK